MNGFLEKICLPSTVKCDGHCDCADCDDEKDCCMNTCSDSTNYQCEFDPFLSKEEKGDCECVELGCDFCTNKGHENCTAGELDGFCDMTDKGQQNYNFINF